MAEETLVDIRQHVLFCGVTMTGKTTLARYHSRLLDAGNYDIAVYDPVQTGTHGGYWPKNAKILGTPEEFHEYIAKNNGTSERPIFLFVDEAADIFGHSETHAHWIPRKIRHNEIYLRMIAQRPKMLHPNVRTQCAVAYVFRMSREDMQIICGDFGHGAEISKTHLDKGDVMLLQSGSAEVEFFNAFDLIPPERASGKK